MSERKKIAPLNPRVPIVRSRADYDALLRAGEDEQACWWLTCCKYPAYFCEEVLGITPWETQRAILASIAKNPRTAVKSCHASGKSFVSALAGAWWLSTRLNSILITTAPTFRQVETVLWAEIKRLFRQSRVPLLGRLVGAAEWKIDDKWFGMGVSTDDPDAFQGIHADHVLCILDEASGVKNHTWVGADAILSGGDCRLLSIGNPTDPLGDFAREYMSLPPGARFTISAFDTPNVKAGRTVIRGLVEPAWVEDKRKRWGERSPLWKARVLGEFPETGKDALIPLSWIEAAQARYRTMLVRNYKTIELGVDVARFGDDETIIALRRDQRADIVAARNGDDTMSTAGMTRRLMAEHRARAAKVDVIGIGAGVVDRLRELEVSVVGMNSSLAAMDRERFANTRAEWYWGLRERFEAGDIGIDPEDHELADQLSRLRYKFNGRGQIQIEGKADIKQREGWSPDRADALMLAFAPEIAAPENFIVDPVVIANDMARNTFGPGVG
jgi:hypothetical protein